MMAHFPMFLELKDRVVLLVGNGPECDYRWNKLQGFGAEILRLEKLTEADFEKNPALVVAGDLPMEENQRIHDLCKARNIPLNVVDVPPLCTVYFPAMIRRGDLMVAIGTEGKSPATAVVLKRRIEQEIPDRCGEILDWLGSLRGRCGKAVLKAAAQKAFELDRPLSDEELAELG